MGMTGDGVESRVGEGAEVSLPDELCFPKM